MVSEPLQRPERAFNFARGDLTFYAPTTQPMTSPLTWLLWPPLIELLVLSAVALYLGIVSEAWRTRPWRVLVVLTLVGMAGMLVAWHGDGQETTRHTIEGFAEVRLGVWLLFALGLLSLPIFDRVAPGRRAVRPGRGARGRVSHPVTVGADGDPGRTGVVYPMPTMGRLRCEPPSEPSKVASPKAKMPPSVATSQ